MSNANRTDAPSGQERTGTEIDKQSLITYCERLTAPDGPLAGEEIDAERVEQLAAYIGNAAGIPRPASVNTDLVLSAATGEDDTQWFKKAPSANSTIKIGDFIKITDYEDRETTYEILPSDDGIVNVQTTHTGEHDRMELTHGAIAELTPEQAEGLAAALVEAAEQARNGGAYE